MCASDVLKLAALPLLCLALLAQAVAQPAPDREQELIRRLRQQVQQLQAQQAGQQQQLAQSQGDAAVLRIQLDQLRAVLARTKGTGAAQAQRLLQAEQAEAAWAGEREQMQARVTELEATVSQAARELAALRDESQRRQRHLSERDAALQAAMRRLADTQQALQTCSTRNDALHALGLELLGRYAAVDVAEVLARREPFLQLKRVELQNQLQGYREQLDQQSVRNTSTTEGRAGSGSGR